MLWLELQGAEECTEGLVVHPWTVSQTMQALVELTCHTQAHAHVREVGWQLKGSHSQV